MRHTAPKVLISLLLASLVLSARSRRPAPEAPCLQTGHSMVYIQ